MAYPVNRGTTGICTVAVAMALGSPCLLVVWPVKTLVVEVPAESVSVTRAV
jgi:hypothetical protein